MHKWIIFLGSFSLFDAFITIAKKLLMLFVSSSSTWTASSVTKRLDCLFNICPFMYNNENLPNRYQKFNLNYLIGCPRWLFWMNQSALFQCSSSADTQLWNFFMTSASSHIQQLFFSSLFCWLRHLKMSFYYPTSHE